MDKIPVIDLFAGPGGLGEGFSCVYDNQAQTRKFDIKLSIEKDEYAHKTLELRSFYRQFDKDKVPVKYYELLQETNPAKKQVLRGELFTEYKVEAEEAKKEAWHAELGIVDESILDQRIREGIKGNKNWVLIGGPPCQAYSVVGRSRVKGIKAGDKRVYLYEEYLRIIAEHQPAVFVMENVRGLLSAKINGESIFQKILEDLKSPTSVEKLQHTQCPDYRIYSLVKKEDARNGKGFPMYKNLADYLIKSENYGIPQKRHRVILLGVRKDINITPDILTPSEQVTLSDVIDNLPKLRSGISRKKIGEKEEKGKIKPIYESIKDNEGSWREIVLQYNKALSSGKVRDFKNTKFNHDRGSEFISYKDPIFKSEELDKWYKDPKLDGVCNHSTRSHLSSDLKRYLFAALFLQKRGTFPKMKDYPDDLLPAHKNARSGKFADRFRVQYPDKPATTITSHISKDGHYFIHYDPLQCRSMTVREAARVQTFPDNYYFCGARTAQYHQVGNAVPPLLAKQIGEIVLKIINDCQSK